jgi:hypothetical protein
VLPGSISLAGGGLADLAVTVKGTNLTNASITFAQGASTYSGTNCTGSDTQRTCDYNFSSLTTVTPIQMTITNAAGSLVLPATNPRGGIDVTP